MGFISIRRKVKEDRKEYCNYSYCQGRKGRWAEKTKWSEIHKRKSVMIITTNAFSKFRENRRTMVPDITGNTRLRRIEPKATRLGIRELPVNVKSISLKKWELQPDCKKVNTEWWWENKNTEERLFSFKCLIVKGKRKTEGCWERIHPLRNIVSTAKFRLSLQVRLMWKPPDSLGFCLFILERAQQSPYNNLQHVHFCLKSLSDYKFWINCFGWIQVKWFFMLLEFCQKPYVLFKFPCYCYLEDCQFRFIPSCKYNFNLQVTQVKLYIHVKGRVRWEENREEWQLTATYFLYTIYIYIYEIYICESKQKSL